MKKFLLILAAGLTFGLTGCNEDESKPYYEGVGTVTSLTDGLSIMSDNDNLLYGDDEGMATKLTVGQRIYFLCYEIREGETNEPFKYLVNYEYVDTLRTKDIQILDEVSRDTIGSDWITVNSSWMKNQYFNIYFTYGGYNQMHYINLVYDAQNQTKQDTVLLELRHQANNDYQSNLSSRIFCFDMSSIDWAGTPPHKVVVRYKNYYSKYIDIKTEYTPPTANE